MYINGDEENPGQTTNDSVEEEPSPKGSGLSRDDLDVQQLPVAINVDIGC